MRGLTKVVRDIRAEAEGPRKKEIELHFVMSNVPDLDDEDRILESKIKAFQNQLGFKREPMIVHRYNSLALLNQVVFTKDRPRSRLAQEYRDVVQEIVMLNPADREGALNYMNSIREGELDNMDFIRRTRRRGMESEPPQQTDRKLQQIEDAHSDDGEVLVKLGRLRRALGKPEQSELLFDRAIEAGYDAHDLEWDRILNRMRRAWNSDESRTRLKTLMETSTKQEKNGHSKSD